MSETISSSAPGLRKGKPVWAIGLMTGTVLDGFVDVAAIRTDGETIDSFGHWELSPYPTGLREELVETLAAAREWGFDGPEPDIFARAEAALTRAQADAVNAVLLARGLKPADIAVIGFHGQTVLHRRPEPGDDGAATRPGATRQLGDGALMARLTNIDTVYDFRSADVAAGGQGAPLAPAYHRALLQRIGAGPETAVLNLGGVGNITWWDGADGLIACDTGPANAPINDWVSRHGRGRIDEDGQLALAGTVDETRLAQMLEHPYFAAPPPKSLDRNDFTAAMVDGLSVEDGAATLTAFAAAAVGRALDLLPERPRRFVVCGGGRRNPALMMALGRRAAVQVTPAEAVGWRGDAVEAECFAFLAVRALTGLPISFPGTTGVAEPMSGGRIARRYRGSGADAPAAE